MDSVRLEGKTVIVTGANTGIGKETARELARRGGRVILACRSHERAEAARQEIVQDTGNDNVVVKLLDLASLVSVRSFAEDINANEDRVDILVNNAGLLTRERQETTDGFEMIFGVNHLGHFLLSYLLLDKLRASAPSRIVIVSSDSHRAMGKLDFKDLQMTRGFQTLKCYGRSKTANILMGIHLAKILQGSGVTTYSLHPGMVDTEVLRDVEQSCLVKCLRCCVCICPCLMRTPETGAATSVYCCLDPSLANCTGRYYTDSKATNAKSYATDPNIAQRLWDVSCELCGVSKEMTRL